MKSQLWLLLCLAWLCGCDSSPPQPAPSALPSGFDSYGNIDPSQIHFKDAVVGQAKPNARLAELELQTVDGSRQTLGGLLNKGNLVVVVTRGYTNPICPYCSTQTSRLITNYDEIKNRAAEVAVIYPIQQSADKSHVPEFLNRINAMNVRAANTPPPFPFLIDDGLKLVDSLGIRKDLSKPATYILDSTGAIRFAYVGETLADRPSIKAVLQQLDELRRESPEKPPVKDDSPDKANEKSSPLEE